MRRKRTSLPIVRLFVIPPLVFLILLGLFGYILTTQRSQELLGLEERIQLQASLIAEKIASRMNIYEMMIEIIGQQVGSRDIRSVQTRADLRSMIQRQLLLSDELEGIFLLADDGSEVYSSYQVEVPQLARICEMLHEQHIVQRMRFSLLSYTHHGGRHMVVSRTIGSDSTSGILAIVVETDRFFEQLTTSLLPGMAFAVLFDVEGTLFGAWNNPMGSFARIEESAVNIDEIPFMRNFLEADDHDAAIRGGSRLNRIDDLIVARSSTSDFPMTLALGAHVPTAMNPFDRSLGYSSLAVITLLLFALVLDHRYVRQSWEKERFQQQMVQELSVQVQERTVELEKLSVIDSLTGLANRRRFHEELEHAIVLHESIGITFSILAMDLDGFKQVNDTLGHLVGDKVLIHITSMLSSELGDRGTLARWGGDELMVLLPESDQAKSAAIAEELRSAVESMPYDRDVQCTISVGVAEHLMHESSLDMIRRADDALYRAKGDGKNRVILAAHQERIKPKLP